MLWTRSRHGTWVEPEGFHLQPYPALLLPFLPSLLNENGIMGFVVYYVCDFSCLKLYHQGVRLLVLPDLGPNKILVSLWLSIFINSRPWAKANGLKTNSRTDASCWNEVFCSFASEIVYGWGFKSTVLKKKKTSDVYGRYSLVALWHFQKKKTNACIEDVFFHEIYLSLYN